MSKRPTSKKLACTVALLGCLAAPVANAQIAACNVADASVSVWNFINETVGLVFDNKVVKIYTAFSKIARFEVDSRLPTNCQTDASKEQILAASADQATNIYNARVNAAVVRKFNAIKANFSIQESDYLISDNIRDLGALQGDALSTGVSGKGAYSMVTMAKLVLLQHRHQLAHSFEDNNDSKGIYGRWFSTATDIITNADNAIRDMNELEKNYGWAVDSTTSTFIRLDWSSYRLSGGVFGRTKNGPDKMLYRVSMRCLHPSGETGPRADGYISTSECGTKYREQLAILQGKQNEELNKYKRALKAEFLTHEKFAELRNHVRNLRSETQTRLNKRNLLYKAPFKDNITNVVIKRAVNDGSIDSELRATNFTELTIKVNDDPITDSKCKDGTVRKQRRGGVALVAFAAVVPTKRTYRIQLLKEDGSVLSDSQNIDVGPETKYYRANFIPQPYYANPERAPLAHWVKIDSVAGDALDLAEIYAFGPDASAGMITSQSSTEGNLVSSEAVDGSRLTGSATKLSFGGTGVVWWEGVLAKPTKVNFIKFVVGSPFKENARFDIQLFGQNGLVFDSFSVTQPSGATQVELTEGLCGQIPAQYVTRVKISGPPGHWLQVWDVEVDPISYVGP
jgi:hypothetical protein